jgi:hypothetical protein
MRIVLALILLVLSISPVSGEYSHSSKFLAVIANPGSMKLSGWRRIRPDFVRSIDDWQTLEPILQEVRRQAGNREVILDIDCHGSPDSGLMALSYKAYNKDFSNFASVGYVVNKIYKAFGRSSKLTVLLEICHPQFCYNRTLKTKIDLDSEDCHVQSFIKDVPWPIYGISNPHKDHTKSPANWNNSVLMSVATNHTQYIQDLRKDYGKPVRPVENKVTEALLWTNFTYMNNFCPISFN